MHLVSISGMSTFAAHVAVLVVIVGAANHFPWMRQRQACWWWQIGWWGDEFADEPSGTSVGAWWRGRGLGGASNLELQPPTPPHSLPIPHPETPQLNKVPQVTHILIVGLQLWRRKQRKKKFGWPDTWSRISSFNMNEMAEWGIFLQTFGTFLVFSIPFLNPFHPCTIGTTTLDLKFISGRHHQHAKGLKEEDFRFSFWILKETKKAFYPPTFSMSKFPKKKMTPLTEEELNAVTSHLHQIILISYRFNKKPQINHLIYLTYTIYIHQKPQKIK